MKDRFDLLLQPPGHHRLGDPVRNRRDGRFILPLLQSCVGIFGSGVELCWPGWPLVDMVPEGTDTVAGVRSGCGGWCAGLRG